MVQGYAQPINRKLQYQSRCARPRFRLCEWLRLGWAYRNLSEGPRKDQASDAGLNPTSMIKSLPEKKGCELGLVILCTADYTWPTMYTCNNCGLVFSVGWIEKASTSLADQLREIPNAWSNAAVACICDPCYQSYSRWFEGTVRLRELDRLVRTSEETDWQTNVESPLVPARNEAP